MQNELIAEYSMLLRRKPIVDAFPWTRVAGCCLGLSTLPGAPWPGDSGVGLGRSCGR